VKKKPPVRLEDLYPTKRAWARADAAVEKLPFSASMQEHIAVWEEAYFGDNGKVGKRVKV